MRADGSDVPPPPSEPEPGEAEEAAPAEASGSDAPLAKAKPEPREEPPPAPPPPERLPGAVEALLLASGEALSAERIRDVLGLPSVVHVREALATVKERWAQAGLAVEVQDVAGGHRAVTRPEYAEYVRRLARKPAADRLTQPLLETLSIVAYRQPVARAEIERIRGVQAGDALRALLDRRLVKVSGRSDQPGRPLLYATTHRFLEVFGLANLEDLPNAKDLTRL
jgi:segregation and condensation protein B